MDRYTRVEKPRPQSAAINENEIRITSTGLIRNYLTYAATLLQEKHTKEIVLKAMGQAISKAVAIAEIIKKRNPDLYQDTSISSVSITDVWEPVEEGLVPLELTRHVSMISIILSTKEPNKNTPGYQPPLHAEQTKHQQNFNQPRQPRQQQQYQSRLPHAQFNEDAYGRGRGRDRGRGRGRGWNRGGYGGYNGYGNNQGGYGGYTQGGYDGYMYNQGGYGGYGNGQENGGWNQNWSRGGGRGRGNWSYRGGGYEGGRGGYEGRGGYGGGRGGVGGRAGGVGGRAGGVGGRAGGRDYGRGRGRMGG